MTPDRIRKQTETWIKTFIIEYHICPFAQRAQEDKGIHYEVIESRNIEQCLQAVFTECLRLDTQTEIDTTFIIFPGQFRLFEDYLDFLAMSELFLIDQNYEGIYQLASFHPEYCFEDKKMTDPSNYTNRSPYPMLHLIRESSIEKALQTYPHPEKIPQRNIQITHEMGLEKVKSILKKCYLMS